MLTACGHADKTGLGLGALMEGGGSAVPADTLALRAIESNAPPAALEAALRTLEAEVANWTIGQPDCPEVSAIRREHAGQRARSIAIAAYFNSRPLHGPVDGAGRPR